MTVGDLPGNPFALVNVVIKRARQLDYGAPARVGTTIREKVVTTALREAKAGRIRAKLGTDVDP